MGAIQDPVNDSLGALSKRDSRGHTFTNGITKKDMYILATKLHERSKKIRREVLLHGGYVITKTEHPHTADDLLSRAADMIVELADDK